MRLVHWFWQELFFSMASVSRVELPCDEDFPKQLLQKLHQQQISQQHTDFVLETRDEKLPCHKAVLAAHSPVLSKMLSVEMKEAATHQLQVMDYNPRVLNSVLHYFYTGSFSVDARDLQDALQVCDFLQLTKLKTSIIERVPATLQASNLLSWQRLAQQYNLDQVTMSTKNMLTTRFTEVTQEDEFLALEIGDVMECLDVCADSVHQDELVRGVCRWLQHDKVNREKHSRTLFKHDHLQCLENCSASLLTEVLTSYTSLLPKSVQQKIKYALANIAQTQLSMTINTMHNSNQAGAQLAQSLPEGKVLVIGDGYNPSTHNCNAVFWILDAHGKYKRLTEIPRRFQGHAYITFEMPHGFGMVGGVNGKACSAYDVRSNIWSDLPQISGAANLASYHQQQIVIARMRGMSEQERQQFGSRQNRPSLQFEAYSHKNKSWTICNNSKSDSSFTSINNPKVISFRNSMYFCDENDMFAAVLDHRQLPSSGNKSTGFTFGAVPVQSQLTSCENNRTGNQSFKGATPAVALDRVYLLGGPTKVCCSYTPQTRAWDERNPPPLHSQAGMTFYIVLQLYVILLRFF